MDYKGRRLDGRYQVEELIGEGGMADVYRGTDLKENRDIAIKILREDYYGNAELVRRFMNEGRAISVLNHPNIVKVYDLSVNDDMYYIVMERINGITLKEYIEQRGEPLTYKEVVHFISQTLLALQHAHDKGVIHRDIKPQNIMITEDGSLRVMDFGIARLARSEVYSETEQAIGSVHYISPEQAQGGGGDLRSDIYSTGIMMYEMLTGTLPFEDESAMAIAVKQISDEAVPIDQVNPSVPPGIAAIAMKAMAKDPGMRYQDALEMLRDIEEFKKNPSIRFEYEYLAEDSPARYVDKMMATQKSNSAARTTGNGKKKKIRRKKVGVLVPIVLGLTIAIVGICGLYVWNMLQNSENPFFVETEEIELPNFEGMDISEVEKLLKTAPYTHLRLKLDEKPNDNVPAGVVTKQNPTSNNEDKKIVKANQRVYLEVSAGLPIVTVPDLTGMSQQQAIQELRALNIIPYAKKVRVADGTPNTVIAVSPEPGTKIQVTPNTMVTIEVVSKYEDYQRTVPSVVGATIEEGVRRLSAADLTMARQIEEVSVEPPGTILRQTPDPGTKVTIGYGVTVYVAIAPPPEPEPEPQPQPVPTPTPTPTPPTPPSSSTTPSSSQEPPPSSSESSSSDSPPAP